MTDGPWNHNTVFHRELMKAVPVEGARVLDVGCGNGLLVERLAATADEVVGVDSDPAAVVAARERLADAGVRNARIVEGDVLSDPALRDGTFDLVTSVAALHHLPLRPALRRMRDLLAPGGHLHVIGIAVSGTLVDHALALGQVVPVRVVGLLRHEASDARMVTARPRDSLHTIRRVAARILPGSRVRRRFYFRYSLEWTKPDAAAGEPA